MGHHMAFYTFSSTSPASHTSPPQTDHAPMSDINVTPLVDVMLVLLVIFILTAPLMAAAIRLNLPASEAARTAPVSHALVLTVDAKGQAFVDDQIHTEAALLERLRQAARQHTATEVQIRADATVPYGRLVGLITTVQQAGLSRVGFVADALPQAAAPATPVSKP
jgi:biopolymer transport protein TolR